MKTSMFVTYRNTILSFAAWFHSNIGFFLNFLVFGITYFFVTAARALIQDGNERWNTILYHYLSFFWVSWENERQGIFWQGKSIILHKFALRQRIVSGNLDHQIRIWTAVVV